MRSLRIFIAASLALFVSSTYCAAQESRATISAAALANYQKAPIAEVPVSSFRTVGGLLFAGTGGQPRGLWSPDSNNFAPRIGLAFRLTDKTIVRAGYGIFYDVLGIDQTDVNQGGFNQPTTLISGIDNGLTWKARLSNPFPDGIRVPTGAAGGLSTFLGQAPSFSARRP